MILKIPTREKERERGREEEGREMHYIQIDASNFLPVLKAMPWLQA